MTAPSAVHIWPHLTRKREERSSWETRESWLQGLIQGICWHIKMIQTLFPPLTTDRANLEQLVKWSSHLQKHVSFLKIRVICINTFALSITLVCFHKKKIMEPIVGFVYTVPWLKIGKYHITVFPTISYRNN